jgi:hypothetical protein
MKEHAPESEPVRLEAEDALTAARPDPAPLPPERSRAILEVALRSASLEWRSGQPGGGLFLFYRTAVALAVPLALGIALTGRLMRGNSEALSTSLGRGGGDVLPLGIRYATDHSAGSAPARTRSDDAARQAATAAGLLIDPNEHGRRSRHRRFAAVGRPSVSRRARLQLEIPRLALALPLVTPAGFGEGAAVAPPTWVAEADPLPSTPDRPILRVAAANVVPRLTVRVRTAAPSEMAGYARVSALRAVGGGRLVWYESTMAGAMTAPGLYLVGSAGGGGARSYR